MVKLFDQNLSRRAIAERAGSPSQFFGVRSMVLDDGVERGIRMLEFRTGSGLRFTVLVDRAMDIGDCEFKGMAIGWHSAAGFRAPGLTDSEADNGLGLLRAFSGLLVTCGLDHALGPMTEDAAHYNYPFRKSLVQPLHGRVNTVPARLTGYGERWDGDECTLWCEGIVAQAAMFGENLHLTRRIEAKVGSNEISITDNVVNRGFSRTPHMLLYHFDVGYPLLAAGSRYTAPIRDVLWGNQPNEAFRAQGNGYRVMPDPQHRFVEQVWEHDMVADANGRVPVALMNDKLGLGFMVETSKTELPCQLEWQNMQSGMYCLGLEPVTHHVMGKPGANERGEMIWLEHGDERRYHIALSVLDGAAEIAAADARIAGIQRQPQDDFPQASGQYPKLHGAA